MAHRGSAIAFAAMHGWHLVVAAAVFGMPLTRARHAIRWLAHRVPPIDIHEAKQWQRSLGWVGTCLTRSLAISARLPDSEVVIGVRRENKRVLAHAWVEVGGGPLVRDDAAFETMARVVVSRARNLGTGPISSL